MLLLLFSCAHLYSPTELAKEAGILVPEHGWNPSVSGAWTAELDGRPPAEQVIEVQRSLGEDGWEVQYQAFQRRDPFGPLLGGGSYYSHQQVLAVDMDRDGKDELLFLDSKSYRYLDDLSVWSWEAEAWRDRIWGLSPGEIVEIVDMNQDKVLELVGFRRAEEGVQVQALCFAQDGLLRPCPTTAPEDWLLPRLEDLAASPDTPGVQARVLLLVAAAELYALRPKHPDALQRKLERRIAETTDERDLEAWVSMMVWAGSSNALPFLTELSHTDSPDPLLAKALCKMGGKSDAVDMVRREMVSPTRDLRRLSYLSGRILHNCTGDSVWLGELIQDRTLPLPARADLLAAGLPQDPAGLDLALSMLTHPELGASALQALVRATREYSYPRWTPTAEQVGSLLTQVPPALLTDMFEVLHNLSDGLPYLEASLKLPLNAEAQLALLQALADLGSETIDPVQFLHHVEDHALRRSLHKNLIKTGDAQRIAKGLTLARDESELGDYAVGLQRLAQPLQGPAWLPVEEQALNLLSTGDAATRTRAIGLLGCFSTPRAHAALQRQLFQSQITRERIAAAHAMSHHPGAEPLIIARLEVLGTDTLAEYEREQLWVALGSMQSPEALNYLAAELKHTPLAWDPAEQLATPQGDALHREYLLSLPTDTPEQCEEAILRLKPAIDAGIPSAPEELRHLLARCGAEDPTPIVILLPKARAETLRALQPELRAWAEHPERTVRVPALEALLKLEEAEAAGTGSSP